MPDSALDPRIQIDLLRRERDYLKSDLKTATDQLNTAIARLVKARRLLKRWVTDWNNNSGGVREADLGTREFLASIVFNEEQ